ncbi:MAG TPA: Flp pilus assembly protein CpaB [Gaiellaceae bacterium]|nr:Flp pilus assembly protein CpaB [Gaiellaceae bacterium]
MNRLLPRYRLRNTILAAALALVGAIFVLLYVTSYRNDVQSGANLVPVFVAARDIPAGTDGGSIVGGGYVQKATVLRRNVVSGAISSLDQLSGLAAADAIVSGEQITIRQFHSAAQQGVLAGIAGNLRAMTVSGQPNQVLAGIAKDGDHVDVLANMKYTLRPPTGSALAGGGDQNQTAARVILRNLVLLRAADSTASGGIGSSDGSSVTLALSDSQAQKLLFAQQNGTWWLVLRPVARPADSPDSVETMQSILGDGLGQRQLNDLTNGYGRGSIGSGG